MDTKRQPRTQPAGKHVHAGADDEPHAHPVVVAGVASVPPATQQVHLHDHPHHQRESVVRRLKRAQGHLGAVLRMVEDGRDCPDILLQIAAVRAALDATARVVLADHVESCLHDASQNGNTEAAWTDLRRALESFIR